MTNKEAFKNVLRPMLECVTNIIILEKVGLLETAKFIELENITIGGKHT